MSVRRPAHEPDRGVDAGGGRRCDRGSRHGGWPRRPGARRARGPARVAGGGTIDQLRQVLGISHSTTVRLIDGLVAEGHVSRADDTDDRRAVALTLTAAGRRTARRILAARREAVQGTLEGLSEHERRSLMRLAEALTGQLVDLSSTSALAGTPPERLVVPPVRFRRVRTSRRSVPGGRAGERPDHPPQRHRASAEPVTAKRSRRGPRRSSPAASPSDSWRELIARYSTPAPPQQARRTAAVPAPQRAQDPRPDHRRIEPPEARGAQPASRELPATERIGAGATELAAKRPQRRRDPMRRNGTT